MIELDLVVEGCACLRELILRGVKRNVISLHLVEVVGGILKVRFFKERVSLERTLYLLDLAMGHELRALV